MNASYLPATAFDVALRNPQADFTNYPRNGIRVVVSRLPENPVLKPLFWVGSSKVDLIRSPEQVRKEVGYALHLA
ncbi:MAG: hypothetical protein U0805_03025 [Pirellulales bacterium]